MEMNKPLISVIMAVYNEPPEWIRAAVDSVLAQTCSDFEFLIINDNPTRGENRRLLEEYGGKDSRIKHVANAENMGLTKSLNRGLDMAKGKYIARMDADDITVPYRFSKQLDFLESNPEYVLCGSWAQYFGEKHKIKKFKSAHEDLMVDMLYDCPIAHSGVMMKGEVFSAQKLRYNENYRTAQDYAMWAELCRYGKLYNFPEAMIKYRISTSRVTIKKRNEQLWNAAQVRRKILARWMSALNVPFDPKDDELKPGASIGEFRAVRRQLLSRKTDVEALISGKNLRALLANIAVLLYASAKKNRVKLVFSLILADGWVFAYQPRRGVKTLLYLLKALPVKESF